jgi:predicted permease
MPALARLRSLVRNLIRRDRTERQLGDELQHYLETVASEQEAAGLSPEAARRVARLEMGGLEQVKEEVRSARAGALVAQLLQDARYGMRTLVRQPRLAAVVVATLATALGGTTAIFGVVDAVLLRSLPYRDPDRLVLLSASMPGAERQFGFSAPDYAGFVERARRLEALAAFSTREYELSGGDRPERVAGARVSASLFDVLGVQPVLGRAFSRREDLGGEPAVILTEGLWRRTFGGDPGILGRAVALDRVAYTVVGVMPANFRFPSRGPTQNNEPAELYVPISFTEQELQAFGNMYNHSVIARLAPGTAVADAQAEASDVARRIVGELYPADFRPKLDFLVSPLRDEVVGRVRTVLGMLMAGIAIVLLMACADIASLLLTQAAGRTREMAVRAALGASRMRLARQMLVETTVLALCGGAVGLAVAQAGLTLFTKLAPRGLPRVEEIGLDLRVVAFAFGLSLVTALVCGIVPAWQASRRDAGDMLKEGGRSGGLGSRQRRILGGLVIAQFALAFILLASGGLLGRSFQRLMATDPGFRPARVLTLGTSLPASSYPTGATIRAFYDRLLERVRAIPGVRAVGASAFRPLGVLERRGFSIDAQPAASAHIPHVVAHDWVEGRYFEALGIPLRRGRYLDEQDVRDGERVVVINEAMARQFWPGEDPLGHRINQGARIVGIVGDVKQGPLNSVVVPQTWSPWGQTGDRFIADNVVGSLRSLKLSIRTDVDPEAIAAAVRQEVSRLDPALPVTDVMTMQAVVETSAGPQRFNGVLVSVFAAMALLLAAVGVGGVLGSSVSKRTHEIGVRLALGASRGDVLRLVMGEGLTLAGVGLAFGLPAALVLTRLISTLLFEISPRDPATFALVLAVLVTVAVGACVIPAWRAARVDPGIALRYE